MGRLLTHLCAVSWLCNAAAGCSWQKEAQSAPVAGQLTLSREDVTRLGIVAVALHDQNIMTSYTAQGRITYNESRVSHIYSPVSGRIESILAQAGARVDVGRPLATIISPDVGVASSDLSKARADLTAARADFARQRDLAAKDAATQRDLENAQDNFERCAAEFERARKKFRLLSVKREKKPADQLYTLRAQLAGEVTARFVNPGAEVVGQYGGGSASELFTVADLQDVWVLVDVYEADLTKVRPGQRVSVRVAALPGSLFDGTVEWISNVLDPVLHTAKLRCTVNNASGLLKPDMFATLSAKTTGKTALVLPRDALVKMGETSVAFVQKPGSGALQTRFDRRPIVVDDGTDSGDSSQPVVVLHGLSRDESVVIKGAASLANML